MADELHRLQINESNAVNIDEFQLPSTAAETFKVKKAPSAMEWLSSGDIGIISKIFDDGSVSSERKGPSTDQERKAQGMIDALDWLQAKKSDTDFIIDDAQFKIDDLPNFIPSEKPRANSLETSLDWLKSSSDVNDISLSGLLQTQEEMLGPTAAMIEQEKKAKSMVDALKWLSENNSTNGGTSIGIEKPSKAIEEYIGSVPDF